MNRRRIVGIVALLALVVAALATRGFGLFAGTSDNTLNLHGNVDIRQVDLGFRVAGRIQAIPLDEGARVAEGAVLAQLDPAPLQDQLDAARYFAVVVSNSARLTAPVFTSSARRS